MHRIFGGRGIGASTFTLLRGSRFLLDSFDATFSAATIAGSPAAMNASASTNPSSASGKIPSSFRIPALEPPFLVKLIRRTRPLFFWFAEQGLAVPPQDLAREMDVQLLKDKSAAKLHLPGVAKNAGNLTGAADVTGVNASDATSGNGCATRRGVVLDIEYVERFKAKLQALPFTQADVLSHGQIRVRSMRASKTIASEGSK